MKKPINITIVILLLIFAAACSEEKQEENTILLKDKITTEKVEPVVYIDTVYSTGFVTYEDEYKLSFKTSGIINNINVNEGQLVRTGQVLASLKLEEIDAKFRQVQNAVEKAQRDYNRAKALYADSVVTLEQLQNAKTQLDQAKLDLKAADFNLRHSQIIAPSKGLIQKVILNENETVQAGSPVLVFGAENTNKILKTNISDIDIVKISIDDSGYVSFDPFPGKVFAGSVKEIAGAADSQTGTYEVKISLPDSENLLKSGFIGNAKIKSSGKKTLYQIPIEALLYAEGNRGTIYVVEQNEAYKREIIIDKINNEKLLVSEGLSESEIIITEGQDNLIGDTVNLNEKSNH